MVVRPLQFGTDKLSLEIRKLWFYSCTNRTETLQVQSRKQTLMCSLKLTRFQVEETLWILLTSAVINNENTHKTCSIFLPVMTQTCLACASVHDKMFPCNSGRVGFKMLVLLPAIHCPCWNVLCLKLKWGNTQAFLTTCSRNTAEWGQNPKEGCLRQVRVA